MSFSNRILGSNHLRSNSNISNQQKQKSNSKFPLQTQSTSLGSFISNNRSKQSATKLSNFLNQKPKSQCQKCIDSTKINSITSQINQYLFKKFSSSQNYYYTRDINDILINSRSKAVIYYKDILFMDESEEFLKRTYNKKEYPHKIKLLAEYYKFHQDIPRLFMLPTTNVLNNYHDKKRRIEYFRISKLIEMENKMNPKRPPKGIVGDKPVKQNSDSEISQDDNQGANMIGKKLLNGISSFINRGTLENDEKIQPIKNLTKIAPSIKKRQIFNKNTQQNQQDDNSLTLLELNKKLEQISQQSRLPNYDEKSMLVREMTQTDLEDFLKFINDKPIQQQSKPILLKQIEKNQKQNSHKIPNLQLNDIDLQKIQIQSKEQQFSSRSVKNASIKNAYEIIPNTVKNEKIELKPFKNFKQNIDNEQKLKIKFELNLKNLENNFKIIQKQQAKNKEQRGVVKISQENTISPRILKQKNEIKPSDYNFIMKSQTSTNQDQIQKGQKLFTKDAIYEYQNQIDDGILVSPVAQTQRELPLPLQISKDNFKKIERDDQLFKQYNRQLISPKSSSQSSLHSQNNQQQQQAYNNYINDYQDNQQKFNIDQVSSARTSAHLNFNWQDTVQNIKSKGHKYTKSDTQQLPFNLNKNLSPSQYKQNDIIHKSPQTNKIKTHMHKKSEQISTQYNSQKNEIDNTYTQQQEILSNLNKLKFSQAFNKLNKGNKNSIQNSNQNTEKQNEILSSERGTNSTNKFLAKTISQQKQFTSGQSKLKFFNVGQVTYKSGKMDN